MLRRTATFCAALAIHAIAQAETVPWGYRDVASAFGIPAEILYAIAKTESAVAKAFESCVIGATFGNCATRKARKPRYVRPGRLYESARRAETRWENVFGLKWVAKFLRQDPWWNPLRPCRR